MEILPFILSWILFAVAASFFASKRGRDPFAWFFLGLFLGFYSLILLFLLTPLDTNEEEKEEQEAIFQTAKPENEYHLKEWFYLDETRKQVGPFPFHVLQRAWADKTLSAHTFVWSEGMEVWKRISELPDFTEALSS